MSACRLVVLVLSLLLAIRGSEGMATEEFGPDSVRGRKTIAQPGWPAGLAELLRHESRVYSLWINGSEDFYFRASPEGINDLIGLYAETRTRDHELWIKAGDEHLNSFGGVKIHYNVRMHVLGGIARAMARTGESPDPHRLALTVFVDPAAADAAFWKAIALPDNIILHNEVAGCPLVGKATKPERKVWFAQVHFDNGTPASAIEQGVATRVTWWEKGVKSGINLGEVGRDGYFQAAFSTRELADLGTSASWLTMTVGNWAAEARHNDPRLPAEKLSPNKMLVQPVQIAAPQFHYGRLLFDDGAPAVLDPAPWPGAEINVEFPYAGSARPDAEGYFKVFFSDEQYEAAKTGKTRKNVYIPVYGSRGSSTARFEFPISKLSRDKAQAGVVTIPRPGEPK